MVSSLKLPSFVLIALFLLLVTQTRANLCSGQDMFHSYLSIELDSTVSNVNWEELVPRSFNEMASLACDYDHRRIIEATLEHIMVTDAATNTMTTTIHVKALVYYKGMTGAPSTNIQPSSIPTLFGPTTFRKEYVEEECECDNDGVDPTGVTLETFSSALEMALKMATDKTIKVKYVAEEAVSSVKKETLS